MIRSAVVPVRLTPEERERLKAQAQPSGMSLSEFVRRAALKRRMPPSAAPEVNRETYTQLCRIGNNLNQLMRAVNESRASGVDPGLLTELRGLVKEVGFQTLGAAEESDGEPAG